MTRTPIARPGKDLHRWRERLIRLPESTFLDLIRNYLGDVRTPFNKQDLLVRLEGFLASDTIKMRLLAVLNLQDRQLLSAIHLADGANEEMLYRLVGAPRSFLEFHLHLLNLEDRLLVYRDELSNGLFINPLLTATIIPNLSESLVVSSTELEDTPIPNVALWFDDRFLAALYGFILESPDLLTTQGSLKKRVFDDFAKRFASLNDFFPTSLAEIAEPGLREALMTVITGLRRLGLLHSNDEGFKPVYERWLEFAGLSTEQRLLLAWAGCLFPGAEDDGSGTALAQSAFFSQAKIAAFARTIATWLSCIHPKRSFSLQALRVLWDIHASMPLNQTHLDQLLRGLILFGLFLPRHGEWVLNPSLAELGYDHTQSASGASASPLTLTPSFELSITGRLELPELLLVAHCARLESYGQVPRFILNRSSCQNGFSRGISAAELLDMLTRHTGHAVSQNIRFSLEDWYKDFAAVRIYDGVVFVCEGQRRAQIEHLPQLRPWILAHVAPGVIILDRGAALDWLPILEAADIPVGAAAHLREKPPISSSPEIFLPPLISLDLEGLALIPHEQTSSLDTDIAEPPVGILSAQAIREELQDCLKNLELGADVREELEKRIRNGLILCREQIGANTVRLERSEARGLDYTAKIRVIEQAVKSRRDFLEITQHSEQDQVYTMLVWPQKLRQMGHELLLSGQTVPEGKELSLVIGKILLVRRIRASIFS